MSTCPTMMVMPWSPSQGDHVVINASEFDPKVHTEYKESAHSAPPPHPEMDPAGLSEQGHEPPAHDPDTNHNGYLTRDEIMADLDRLGIEYDARLSRAKLDALLHKEKPAREAAVNASVEED